MPIAYAGIRDCYLIPGQPLDEHSIPLAPAPRLPSWLHRGCIVRVTRDMYVHDVLFPYAAWAEEVFSVPKPHGTGCATFFTFAWRAESGDIERGHRWVESAADRDLMHATVEHARKLGKRVPTFNASWTWGLRDADSEGVVAQYGSLLHPSSLRHTLTNSLPASISAGYNTQYPDEVAVDPAVASILDIFTAFGDGASAAIFGTTALAPVSVGAAPIFIRGGQGDFTNNRLSTPAYPLGEALFGGHSVYPGLHIQDTFERGLRRAAGVEKLLVKECAGFGGAPVIVNEVAEYNYQTDKLIDALIAAHLGGVNVLAVVGRDDLHALRWNTHRFLRRRDELLIVTAAGDRSTIEPLPDMEDDPWDSDANYEDEGTVTRSAMFSAWLGHLCRTAAGLGGVAVLRQHVACAVQERKDRMLAGGAPHTPRTDTLAHALAGVEMFCGWAATYTPNADTLRVRAVAALDELTNQVN